jgi:PKD repeat protein
MSEVETQTVAVSATDPEGAPIVLGISGNPSFADLVDDGDGTGDLLLFPAIGDAGNHTVTLTATSSSGTGTLDVSVAVSAVTRAPGGLFHEPPSACMGGAENGGTLTLFNRSTKPLIIQPVRLVAGADALNQRRVLDPETYVDVAWTWSPGGPYPAADTLIALTNDPQTPRLAFPLRREDPAGFTDVTAPDAPLLAFPADGAVFALAYNPATMADEAEIPVGWSVVDDCSGIDHYRFQIAADPGFTSVLFGADLAGADTTVVAEDGDQGTAYWRVLAVDGKGLTSVPSAVRSWTITGP